MGSDATSTASGPANRKRWQMTNSNGTARTLITWLLGLLATVVAAVIIGGGAASISTKLDVREIKTEQRFIKGDLLELRQDVQALDGKLEEHQRATVRSNSGSAGGEG